MTINHVVTKVLGLQSVNQGTSLFELIDLAYILL